MSGAGDFLDQLREIVGEAHVLTDADVKATYETDWTRRFSGASLAVVRPGSTREVAAITACCNEAGVAIVPQGGNTGLVGGSVPRGGEVVLSLVRLAWVGDVDEASAQVSVGAGLPLARLAEHAAGAGLMFGVDLSARDSATLGGMIATNAGGLHVLRYGPMRSQLTGVELVLADGSVVRRMDGLVKDNTGYDLASLVCGSEGTLAIVTEARVRLVDRPAQRVTALVATDGLGEVLALLPALRRLASLEAVELMFDDGIDLVCENLGIGTPFPRRYPCVLTLECAAERDPTDELAAAVAACPATAVASDAEGRRHLWSWRELHTEAVNAVGVPHKLDVTLPLSQLTQFVRELRDLRTSGVRFILWGHVAEGNLHVNILGPQPDDLRLDDRVLHLAAARGGSISSEHGIGVAKRTWLPLTRSPADIAAMSAIKRALDPVGILNPGVLFPE